MFKIVSVLPMHHFVFTDLMACIASILLSSSQKVGVFQIRNMKLSLRNGDLVTINMDLMELNTIYGLGYHVWQGEMPH